MVKVKVWAGDADEEIGVFDFEHLPRAGDSLTIPWPADPAGWRFFTVGEVEHVATGITGSQFGDGPTTVLRYCFEIT